MLSQKVPLVILNFWMFVYKRRPEESGLIAALAALLVGLHAFAMCYRPQ
jgi:hypothetical protein